MNSTPWYYARGGSPDRSGPVPAAVLREMLADGRLAPDDLVWRDGFPEWVRAGVIRELQAGGASLDAFSSSLRHWMALAAILCLIAGIVRCLTLVRMIPGILLIIAGAALFGARAALINMNPIDASLLPFFHHFRRFLQVVTWALFLGVLAALFWGFFQLGLFAGILKGLSPH